MAESAKVVGRSESLELADLLREPDEGGARGAEIERKKLFPDSFFEDIANDPDAGSTLPKGGRPRKLLLYRSPGKQRRLHMVRDSHLSAQSLIVLPETHTREAPGKEEWDNTLEYLALQECVAEVQPKKRSKLPYDEEPQVGAVGRGVGGAGFLSGYVEREVGRMDDQAAIRRSVGRKLYKPTDRRMASQDKFTAETILPGLIHCGKTFPCVPQTAGIALSGANVRVAPFQVA